MSAPSVDRVVRARDLLGMPVVTLGGDDCAEIRDVVYQSESGTLFGFTLNKRSWFGGRLPEMLLVEGVHAIGRDAVMIPVPDALVESDAAPEAMTHPQPERDVIGATVLTESGTSLGEVTDVIVAVGRAVRAVGYEVTKTEESRTPRYVPLPEQIAISGEALVVPDEVDRFVEDDLAGFGASVTEFRSQLHEPTERGTTS